MAVRTDDQLKQLSLSLSTDSPSDLDEIKRQIDEFVQYAREDDIFSISVHLVIKGKIPPDERVFPSLQSKNLDLAQLKEIQDILWEFRTHFKSMNKVAKAVGISVGTLYKMREGGTPAQRITIEKLARGAPTPELRSRLLLVFGMQGQV